MPIIIIIPGIIIVITGTMAIIIHICIMPKQHCSIRSRQAMGLLMYSFIMAMLKKERIIVGMQDKLRMKAMHWSRMRDMGICALHGAVVPHIPSICAGMKVMGMSMPLQWC
jgi:hypothetical protein